MSEVTLFKNTHGSVNAALANGVTVAFTEGRFFTTDSRLEDYLKAQAKYGEFGIYIDPNEPTIDPEAATPMDQLKKKVRAELMAELAAAGQLVKDAGTSEQGALNMATSQDAVGGVNTTLTAQALAAAQEALAESEENKVAEEASTATTTLAAGSSALDALAKLKAGQNS